MKPRTWLQLLLGTAAMLRPHEHVAAGTVEDAVRLITLDPGHFHAALFQKEMLPGVAPRVHIYAPCGPDLLAHLGRINAFNARPQNPTTWELEVHATPDFMARLLEERPGNVVILSGRNRGKIARMEALVGARLHLLADKPWIIEAGEFAALERTLALARKQRVTVYDGMTQRHEITCILQNELVNDPAVFGTAVPGSVEEPAVYMESVHYLKKEVAGAPLLRPWWFFDPREQGEPLTDVGTHLVDLVQWMLSPEKALDFRTDVVVLRGSREVIGLSIEQFSNVTGLREFPASLAELVHANRLEFAALNRVTYALRGVHVQLDVRWDYETPAGGGDTEYALFRGSRARVEVRQGREEKFVPEVFVTANAGQRNAVEAALRERIVRLAERFPGLAVEPAGEALHVRIPANLREGHEAHFALLVRQFLAYQKAPDTMPAWEAPYLLAKYFVTTEGVRLARQNGRPSRTAVTRSP